MPKPVGVMPRAEVNQDVERVGEKRACDQVVPVEE